MDEQILINTPLVNIVMATFNPRMDWLKEQLQSLNEQTYENIIISIRDDCSYEVSLEEIKTCIKENITKFSYSLTQNTENIGSNKTFEKLTEQAEGEYIAYCDQDDVWSPEKIQIYVDEIKKQHSLLVCSDMYIIDNKSKIQANSITKVRRHHIFKSGRGLAEQLIFSNFVTGCAMMIKTNVAKNAIPFCPYMVHDHYLALFSANQGNIAFIDKPLIHYRIHNSNQTLMMAGVNDRKTYIQKRIDLALDKMYWLKKNFSCDIDLKEKIGQGIEWLKARKENMGLNGKTSDLKVIWKYRRFSKLTSIFEIVAAHFPDKLFMQFIKLKKKNIL